MNCYKICLLIPFLLFAEYSLAQNYHGINGSSYSGSLAPGSNPAAIVHVPYAWDITLFSMQFKQSTNAFKIEKYSFLSSPKNIKIATQPGIKKRYLSANRTFGY